MIYARKSTNRNLIHKPVIRDRHRGVASIRRQIMKSWLRKLRKRSRLIEASMEEE